MTLKSSALVVAAFAGYLPLAMAVHPQPNATGRLDPSDAAQLRDLAERGHADTAFQLGIAYVQKGVEEDYAEAVRWFRLAAEQGHPRAQFNLGVDYALGQGVEEDAAEAARWLRLAAEQGHSAAMYLLGGAYEIGAGVERDFSEAVRWYRLAAGRGHDEAKEHIASLETW